MPKKPDLLIRPSKYQPSRAELEEDMSVDATPEELARAALRHVNVRVIGEDSGGHE